MAAATPRRGERREPITSTRIVDAALEIMARDGFEAVTMRSIAHRLGTGPASLYAHLDGKRELYSLIVDRLTAEIVIPEPDPAHWQDQLAKVGEDLRAAMHRLTGVAQVVIGHVPVGTQAMVTSERLLAILSSGGVPPRVAAWTCDLLPLYVAAVAFEESARRADRATVVEVRRRLAQHPVGAFPQLAAHAVELTSGTADERFAFGLRVLIAGIAAVSAAP